jgi:hypothetical protein
MKKALFTILILSSLVVLSFQFKPVKRIVNAIKSSAERPSLINKDSVTIQSRVNIPKGYKRVVYSR